MELTIEQKKRIAEEINGFKKWLTDAGKNERIEHLDHGKLITVLVEESKLDKLDNAALEKLYNELWASRMWSNKKWYVENKMILPNGIEKIKTHLKNLLYGKQEIAFRYDVFMENISGFGPAIITEILHFVHPDKNCLWNDKPKRVLPYLGIDQLPNNYFKYKLKDGEAYSNCIELIGLIKNELSENGFPNSNFIDTDLFFWYLYNKITDENKKRRVLIKTENLSDIGIEPSEPYNPSFIPPIVADLPAVSINEKESVNFEKKVGILFKMLGYKITQLGAGRGNAPDIIARGFGQDGQYVILVDCKARSHRNYQIGTDDQRAISDYIKRFFREHENRGAEVYFLIVSSGYHGDSLEKILEIRRESRIKSVSLITADDLLFLLELKLQNYKIDIDTTKEILLGGGIISRDRVIETFPSE